MLIYVRIVPALDIRRICFLTAMAARISTCSSGCTVRACVSRSTAWAESLIPAVTHEGTKSQSTGLVTRMLFPDAGVDTSAKERERERVKRGRRTTDSTEGGTDGRGTGRKS